MEIDGKTALVTGASRGIGPVIAQQLSDKGANVLLAARSADDLAQVSARIGGNVQTVTCDVNDEDDRRNLPKRARAEFGQIDILVNNAGIEEIKPYPRQAPDDIELIMQTNLLAPMLLAREVLPYMIERGYGHIVNISSLAGRVGFPYAAAYTASKGGMAEWSLALNMELDGSGVGASVVCPGFVLEAGMFARKEAKTPRVMGSTTPHQVAEAVIRAIEHSVPEIIVNSTPMRPLMALRAISPKAVLALMRRTGSLRMSRKWASKP